MGTELFLQHCSIDRPLCRRLLLDISFPRHLLTTCQDETQRWKVTYQQICAHFQSIHPTLASLHLYTILLLALHASIWGRWPTLFRVREDELVQ